MTAVRAELARLSRHAGIRALLLAQAAIWLALAVVLALDAGRDTLAGGESQAALSGLGQVLSELGFWAVAPQLPLALGALAGAWRPGRPRPPQAATSAAAALLVMAVTVLLLALTLALVGPWLGPARPGDALAAQLAGMALVPALCAVAGVGLGRLLRVPALAVTAALALGLLDLLVLAAWLGPLDPLGAALALERAAIDDAAWGPPAGQGAGLAVLAAHAGLWAGLAALLRPVRGRGSRA